MQDAATHCNARQRTATHCNTLQHTALQVGGTCPECGDETVNHAENDALDQLASKFTFQKQALASLFNNPVFAPMTMQK